MHCQGPSSSHIRHGNYHIKEGYNYGGLEHDGFLHHARNIINVGIKLWILPTSKDQKLKILSTSKYLKFMYSLLEYWLVKIDAIH